MVGRKNSATGSFSCLGDQLILLQHRAESLVAEDQVVEYPDTEQLARLQQPLRDIDIVVAGDEDTAGMVVCDYDRGSPFPKRIAEDLYLCLARKTITSYML